MEFTSRQQEIVESAIDIISKNGLEGFTTKSLSASIGLTEAALYRHFPCKNDILVGILDYFGDRAAKLLENAVRESKTSVDKIYSILKKRTADFIEKPALMVVILSEEMFPSDSRLSEKVYGIMSLNRKVILGLLEEGQRSGEIRKDIAPETLFYLILGPYRFIVTRWRLSNFTFELEKEFENYWEAVGRVIRAPGEEADERVHS